MKIKVIVGTTRKNRFSEKPAKWIFEEAKKRKEFEVELLDLKDYPLPFFEEGISPSMGEEKYTNPILKKWFKKIDEADGFIIVAAEYNHGYPAVLKNALDYVYKAWNKKAVGFLSYGSVGGARSVEQLRQVAVELQMAPIRASIHIFWPTYMEISKAKPGQEKKAYESLNQQKDVFFEQLSWWTKALKEARH